jgi:hypothetical protein
MRMQMYSLDKDLRQIVDGFQLDQSHPATLS